MSNWFRTYGFAEILPEFLIGAYPTDESDVAMLHWLGIKRILNLCEDEEYPPGAREVLEDELPEAGIEERRISLRDFGGLPAEAIDEAVSILTPWLEAGERTYLHCRAGQQRSATVAAAVVALRKRLDPDEAMAFIHRAKPSAEPLPHQREDLLAWWAHHMESTGGEGDGEGGRDGADRGADASPQPAADEL
jgi:protein-tyrosine phosphatase